MAPLDVSPWSVAAWCLAGTGHALVGEAVAAGSVAALVRRVPAADSPEAGRDVAAELSRLASMGHLRSGEALAAAVTRSWWPLAVVGAVVSRRARRALGATAVLPPMVNWLRDRPDLDLARWTALHLADDVAYGAGVWSGCWRERSITALLPRRRAASDVQ